MKTLILILILFISGCVKPYKHNYAFVNNEPVGTEYACKLGVLYLYWIEYEVALDINNNTIACTVKVMTRNEYDELLNKG